jgi:hypothetical protein
MVQEWPPIVGQSSTERLARLSTELRDVKARCSAIENALTHFPLLSHSTPLFLPHCTSRPEHPDSWMPLSRVPQANVSGTGSFLNFSGRSGLESGVGIQSDVNLNQHSLHHVISPGPAVMNDSRNALADTEAIFFGQEFDSANASQANNDEIGENLFNFNATSMPLDFDISNRLNPFVVEQGNVADPNISATPSRGPSRSATVAAQMHPAYQCSNCGKSYARRGDRDRHTRTHNPNARRYSCPHPGCNRVGLNGFLRKDKFMEHRTRNNH